MNKDIEERLDKNEKRSDILENEVLISSKNQNNKKIS